MGKLEERTEGADQWTELNKKKRRRAKVEVTLNRSKYDGGRERIDSGTKSI